MDFPQEKETGLEVVYMPNSNLEFVTFIKMQGSKAALTNIEGHARWVITREDGSRYILRPDEAKPHAD